MGNEILDNIKILYEDENILAIDKPSGLMVHPDGRAKGPFLTDWIIRKFPQALNVGEPARAQDGSDLNRSGIVHRLDAETSGALLVAKSARGFECLKKQFQARTVKKKYLAFVWGEMKEDFGTINRPIGRSSSDFRKKSAQRGARGELWDAETYWIKLKSGNWESEKFTLIEAEPKTGRTHQIRAHFSSIQHPIVGDKLYAPKKSPALGFTRTALHSKSIEFDSCEGKRIKVEASSPIDFENAREELDFTKPTK